MSDRVRSVALAAAFSLSASALSAQPAPAAEPAPPVEPAPAANPPDATEPARAPAPPPPPVAPAAPAPAAPAPGTEKPTPAPVEAPIAAGTPAPAPAEAGANDAADEALLAELDAELRNDSSIGASSQPRLNIYGFADFAFYKYFLREDSGMRGILYTKSAFAVGNLNIYLAGNLGANWNSMAEIRFAYLPNGARKVVDGQVERTDTSSQDYASLGLEHRTGSIIIERAFLEHLPTSWLSIRGGQWLTPYGIWNVDHGSPTIIPVNRPFVISYALMPERQTGLEIEATYDAAEDLQLGAVLGLSNGRGPLDEYADLDENKALTARVSATWRDAGMLQLGATGYFGRYTDLEQSAVVNGAGARIEDHITEQFDELVLAADVLYKLGGFHFQAEFLSSQQRYTDEGRPRRNAVEFWPDHTRYGVYGVTGYRFERFGLMPYVMAEYFNFSNNFEPARPPAEDAFVRISPGLNARPTPSVTLKLQGEFGFSPIDLPAGAALEHPLWGVQSQAAWAF